MFAKFVTVQAVHRYRCLWIYAKQEMNGQQFTFESKNVHTLSHEKFNLSVKELTICSFSYSVEIKVSRLMACFD